MLKAKGTFSFIHSFRLLLLTVIDGGGGGERLFRDGRCGGLKRKMERKGRGGGRTFLIRSFLLFIKSMERNIGLEIDVVESPSWWFGDVDDNIVLNSR